MDENDRPDRWEVIPLCPLCGSKLAVAHNHSRLKICVCRGCGTSLTIPDDAWLRARMMWASEKQMSQK